MIVAAERVARPDTLRVVPITVADNVVSPLAVSVPVELTDVPVIAPAPRVPKVVVPVTPSVVATVVACSVVVPSDRSVPVEYTDVPVIAPAPRVPRVVTPVTPSVVATVVACNVLVPSTFSPPDEYSDDPEIVDAWRPVREVEPDTLSVPPVYTETLDAESVVNAAFEKLAWPDTFKLFTTQTLESVARPEQTLKAEPVIVADPETSKATDGFFPIPKRIPDKSPCKNGNPLVVEYIVKKLLWRGLTPPGLLPR